MQVDRYTDMDAVICILTVFGYDRTPNRTYYGSLKGKLPKFEY